MPFIISQLKINVEPALIILSLCIGILITVIPLFTFWGRCVEIADQYLPTPMDKDYGNNTIRCANIFSINETMLRNGIEEDIAEMKIYYQLAGGIPTLISSPILGLWSDVYGGRKKVLTTTLFGLVIYISLQLYTALNYDKINMWYPMIFAEFIMGCFGGIATIFTSAVAILIDDSRKGMDDGGIPMRITITTAFQSLFLLFGNYLASYFMFPATISIQKHSNSYIILIFISFISSILIFIYTAIFVKTNKNEENIPNETLWQMFGSVFSGLLDVLKTPRRGYLRCVINISMFLVFIDCMTSDPSLFVLLLKGTPFYWPDVNFTYYIMLKTAIGCIDSILLMIGFIAASIIAFLTAFAETNYLIFITGSLYFFAAVTQPGFRTFLPKLVGEDQTARLFTLISLLYVIAPILSLTFLNIIYEKTFKEWPGFVFVIIGIFNCFGVISQFISHYLLLPMWKENTINYNILENNE
ncbi:Major facilitator superfamily and Major facilitator superfamily domain, general substrate transporter-containing protein [Strongyloides ratti]|uniref:Major facilitator superfamily and Major facilitator superfamily domain, general substrate transporter-containing protein n=1 Tax=Strongyloides ratti TaxID=34506 RepID=A0A090LQ95_STRRB|nr:Major facilitator superfamily and Major facilitator superfamily domain, general substrate transporter-containing protein [Strongyloides ratti]CEF69711.1 Major facilitator superfamily and Major facilitator superfamily domain, general substrate transporter-containing protein [Strongyloides ratti]